MLIGYARVSTADQSHNLQTDALTAAGCTRIFTETASGAQRNRPKLAAAMRCLKPGDTLVVWRLDRWARNLAHLLETVEQMERRGVMFRSLTEAIDSATPMGKLILHIFGAVAEFERAVNHERTCAGLAAARARGRVGGRPRAMTDQDAAKAVGMLANSSASVAQIAGRFGVAVSTLYRYLRRNHDDQHTSPDVHSALADASEN